MNQRIMKLLKPLTAIFLTLNFVSFALAQEKGSEIKDKAKQYVEVNDIRLKQMTDSNDSIVLLAELAPAALASGDKEKAHSYALQLMAAANKTQSLRGPSPSRRGFSLHVSNIVLGRIAFEDGNINLAKEYLLAAGRVTGNPPVLATFGPDMLLAKLLLEKGERDTVIQYFDLCAKFWEKDRGLLKQWKTAVNSDKMPDFGANLVYIETWQVGY